jgi:hypothetical protein
MHPIFLVSIELLQKITAREPKLAGDRPVDSKLHHYRSQIAIPDRTIPHDPRSRSQTRSQIALDVYSPFC